MNDDSIDWGDLFDDPPSGQPADSGKGKRGRPPANGSGTSGGKGPAPDPERPKRKRYTTAAYWQPHAERALAELEARAGAGRPTKLTPLRLARLLAAIAGGDTLKAACGLVRINYATFYRWVERGDKGERGYSAFRKLVLKATALAESELRQAIKRDPSWQSKAWLLERRNPADYGRQQKLDVQVSGTIRQEHTHTHTLQAPPDATVQQRLQQLQVYTSTPELAPVMSPDSPADESGDITSTPADFTEVD